MKFKSHIKAGQLLLCAVAVSLGACSDPFKNVEAPDGFRATTPRTTYKVGETVTFNLSGSSDFVVFYSGEEGSDYAWRNKDRLYEDEMQLTFKSAQTAGNNIDCGKLYYGTDFIGIYEEVWAKLATWTDITDKFVYPTHNAGSTVVYFDSWNDTKLPINVNDLFEDPNQPIYFCWHFTTQANSERTRFRVSDWEIRGKNTKHPFYTFVDSKFRMILSSGFVLEPGTPGEIQSSSIYWNGVFNSTVFKEGWAISGPIRYSDFLNAGPDRGQVIKTVEESSLRTYNHQFSEPGEYTVTFVGFNVNVNGREETVTQTRVIIEPDDTPPPTDPDVLEIHGLDSRSITLAADDITTVKKFNVYSTKRWDLTDENGNPLPDWLSVTPPAGSGGRIYTISVKALQANDTGGPRTATVKITADGISEPASFTVTQNDVE